MGSLVSGIYDYDESDDEATFSDLLNLLTDSVRDRFATSDAALAARPAQPRAAVQSKNAPYVASGTAISTTNGTYTTLAAADFGIVSYARIVTVTFNYFLNVAAGSGSDTINVGVGLGGSGLAVPATWATGGTEGFTARQVNYATQAAGSPWSGTVSLSAFVPAGSASNGMFVLGAYRSAGTLAVTVSDAAGYATQAVAIEVDSTNQPVTTY